MSSSDKKNRPDATFDNLETVPTPATSTGNNADKDTAWDRRVRIVSGVSFFLGCVWIFLFPLVTLTTGESKPRGTFFDENAMLVHHTATRLTAADVDWAKPARLSEAYPQQVRPWRGSLAWKKLWGKPTLKMIACDPH